MKDALATTLPTTARPGEIPIPEALLPETADLSTIITMMDGLCGAAGDVPAFEKCPYTFYFNVAGETPNPRVVIVTMDPRVHAALMRDLKAVEQREADKLPRLKLMKLSAGPKTNFRTIFEQMAEMPLSAFSVTCPNPSSGEFLFAQFFVRTGFTIGELRKEMAWANLVALEPEPARRPNN